MQSADDFRRRAEEYRIVAKKLEEAAEALERATGIDDERLSAGNNLLSRASSILKGRAMLRKILTEAGKALSIDEICESMARSGSDLSRSTILSYLSRGEDYENTEHGMWKIQTKDENESQENPKLTKPGPSRFRVKIRPKLSEEGE